MCIELVVILVEREGKDGMHRYPRAWMQHHPRESSFPHQRFTGGLLLPKTINKRLAHRTHATGLRLSSVVEVAQHAISGVISNLVRYAFRARWMASPAHILPPTASGFPSHSSTRPLLLNRSATRSKTPDRRTADHLWGDKNRGRTRSMT